MKTSTALRGPLKALFESGLLGVTISTLDGKFTEVNASFLAITGYQESELERLDILEITSAEEWASAAKARRRILAGEIEHCSEVKKIRRRDGRTIRAQVTYSLLQRDPTLFVTFVEELGAREALLESQQYRYAIFENSGDAMLLFNDEGLYVEANHAAEEILGRPAREIIGSKVGSLAKNTISSEDLLEQFRTNKHLRMEGTVHRADCSIREIESIITSSVIDGIHLCIARDVTDRKSLERQLQQAQKMEAVGRLAGGVAHDINNMLTAIRGYSEMMKRKMQIDSPHHRYCDMIIAAADRSSNITQQLLAFSRRQVLQPAVLEFQNVVSDVLDLLSSLLGEDITITTELSTETGKIRADAGQMGQVIMNLVVNARDAMPDGGRLHVATRQQIVTVIPEGALIPITPGPYAVLTVTDCGCGISDELRGHIFEPFFTTKEQYKGTGLGLATVYAIVEQSKGTIVTTSELGVGTTFEVFLPVVEWQCPIALEYSTSERETNENPCN
jgi:PAS domain S-box-containing protein